MNIFITNLAFGAETLKWPEWKTRMTTSEAEDVEDWDGDGGRGSGRRGRRGGGRAVGGIADGCGTTDGCC